MILTLKILRTSIYTLLFSLSSLVSWSSLNQDFKRKEGKEGKEGDQGPSLAFFDIEDCHREEIMKGDYDWRKSSVT